jgi:transposase InsO family protein
VRDAFANRIVGWATDPRATTVLVLTALNHALRSREVRAGQLIFHSDKGAQYTALRFTQRLVDAGVAPSTGSTGDSFDNALAENLWSTIKVELLYWPGTTFATRVEAEHALIRYIDGWYNPRRILSGSRTRLWALTCGFKPRSYSLISPPRIGWRLIRFWARFGTGRSGRGGRSRSARCGRRPL